MTREGKEYPAFWRRWFLRLTADTGFGMLGLGSCIGVFECSGSALSVVACLLIYLLPVRLIKGLRADRMRRLAFIPAVFCLMLSCLLPLTALWQMLLVALAGSAARMLAGINDLAADMALLPNRQAVDRMRGVRLCCAGILAPALSTMLMSYASFEWLLPVAAGVMGTGILLDGILAPADAAPLTAAASDAVLPAEIRVTGWTTSLCMSMTAGALLTPMLLLSMSVGTLAGVISCYFIGLLLGGILEPLRDFFDDSVRSFCKSGTVLLLMIMLFGMARAEWQWNLLSVATGVLISGMNASLIDLQLRSHVQLRRETGLCALAGLPVGLLLGWLLEYLNGRSAQTAEFFARLTGQGEGSGCAMVFVIVGFAAAIILDAAQRRLRREEDE